MITQTRCLTRQACRQFACWLLAASTAVAADLSIERLEPTPLFPQPAEGQMLRQRARLYLDNPGAPFIATARITVGATAPYLAELGQLPAGKSTNEVLISDIAAPTDLTVELLRSGSQEVLARKQTAWQPQKKWTFYCVSYSHQDLGYGDYPHRLRTSIRHENIKLPLEFCRETDAWPADDKYRFNIETSEPITSFISFNGKEAARELAQRLREGRIELGGLHNTANTEELSHELMARLFYMSGRYAVDLLGVSPNKTMQNDDVVGLTWPLATYGAAANLSYIFHGYNGCGHCEQPAESGPVFFWQAPDGSGRLLERATAYGGYSGDNVGDGSSAHIEKSIARLGVNWPYDALLLQEGSDFQLVTMDTANKIHAWNRQYRYPRMIYATMDMFFDAIARQIDPSTIKTFAKDSNNQWSDEDYAAARATGQARRLTEALPATETLATIAQALSGGGDQWINLFQGYHRLLQYFEHTNAKDSPRGNMVWYETELEENREMVTEAGDYQQEVFTNASQRIASVITRAGEYNLIVFNPLPYSRTDIVRADLPANLIPMDTVTGTKPLVQQLPDGTTVFLAENIPATGYKTYSLFDGPRSVAAKGGPALESKYYRIAFSPNTGTITSVFDKSLDVELVETNAPHAFNEYLYEYRTHTTGLNFDSVWSRMEKADSVSVERGSVADVLTVTGTAEGVRALKQTVILYHDLPRVDFGIWMDKAPFPRVARFPQQHEAVFVALPLAIPNFTIRHELPGAVIEPYRQQYVGSATDHYAIRSFTDLSNEKYGVTLSPVEGSLVCYGEPTSSPMLYGQESNFKRDQTYPAHSRLYLYLLNNMFDVNIAVDQRGPVSFQWALRSHAGDWKAGGADRFGRSVQQPLLAWRADGKHRGALPASGSFMSVDAPNVMCSVIKPAEANGRGFIIRLNETTGHETIATVSLPMLKLESARATSLVENDRPEQYPVTGHSFKITLPKFGVKTVRVTCAGSPISVAGLSAKAVADAQVDLSWKSGGQTVSHFNIYRDTKPDCTPRQLNFIGQTITCNFTDRPRVNLGGWLRSCLSPKTTYYYRVVPVDRVNNLGTPSDAAPVTTLSSTKANLPPIAVEGLRAILVSPISKDNFVNLLFRTSCEPDVVRYEIYRGTQSGRGALAGVVNSDDIPPRSGGYGESQILYKVKEYDHATFADHAVEPGTTYYYKIRAVDSAGQEGPFSLETSVRTEDARPPAPPGAKASASSVFASLYAPEGAIDEVPSPDTAWISAPWGGGTRAKPSDTWLVIELPRKLKLKGTVYYGDERPVIPLLRNFQVQVRQDGQWTTTAKVTGAATRVVTNAWPEVVETDALRFFVLGQDLPEGDPEGGVVRVCELELLLPDGRQVTVAEALDMK